MKLIKYLFFLILILLIGGAIYFGTKDGSYNISESKVIKAPSNLLFSIVNNYKDWPSWSPWLEKDPDTKLTFSENTSGEGASFTWDSEDMEVGSGAMETLKVIPNKKIEQQINFNIPIGTSKSDVWWDFEATQTPGETKVTWGMKGEQTLIEKVFMSFMEGDFETMVRTDYKKGLENLAKKATIAMQKNTTNVDGITQYDGGHYLYATTSCTMNDIGAKMEQLMGQIVGFMQTNEIPMAGYPYSIYNQIDKDAGTVIFSAAVPIKAKTTIPNGSPVVYGFMPPITTLKTSLKGDYKYLPDAYAKAKEYLLKNNLNVHPTIKQFEVYPTDPYSTPNPANWLTEVYMPIVTPEQ